MAAILRRPSQMPVFSGRRPRREAEVLQGIDEDLLQKAEVGVEVRAARQVHDRVAHDLARPVVGHVAAPVGLDQVDSRLGAAGLIPHQVLIRAPPQADGEHRIVLGENQRVPNLPREAPGHQILLAAGRFRVPGAAPVQGGLDGRGGSARGHGP